MRCYCKNCGSEFYFTKSAVHLLTNGGQDENIICPVCIETLDEDGNNNLIEIPDYETPYDWEARTGDPLRNNAAVWWRKRLKGFANWTNWKISTHKKAWMWGREVYVVQEVVANTPYAPPDDFEEGK